MGGVRRGREGWRRERQCEGIQPGREGARARARTTHAKRSNPASRNGSRMSILSRCCARMVETAAVDGMKGPASVSFRSLSVITSALVRISARLESK